MKIYEITYSLEEEEDGIDLFYSFKLKFKGKKIKDRFDVYSLKVSFLRLMTNSHECPDLYEEKELNDEAIRALVDFVSENYYSDIIDHCHDCMEEDCLV